MRKSTLVLMVLFGLLLICIAVMMIGGDIAHEQQTQTAQFATEWQRDIVNPIQTEHAQ